MRGEILLQPNSKKKNSGNIKTLINNNSLKVNDNMKPIIVCISSNILPPLLFSFNYSKKWLLSYLMIQKEVIYNEANKFSGMDH